MSERFSGRAGIAGLGVATALLVGACSAGERDTSPADYFPQNPAVDSQQNTQTLPPTPEVPKINTSLTALPNFMNRVINSTVEITANDTGVVYKGSGTIINYKGTKVVVTAAHVVNSTDKRCANETIAYPGSHYNASYENVTRQSPAKGDNEHYDPNIFNGGLDATVMFPGHAQQVPNVAQNTQEVVDLEPGDRLFSLGYGPRSATFDPDPLSSEPALRKPVIVPGAVLRVSNGQIDFLTSINGYAPTKDGKVEPGDSGGTVVDGKGRYIGDVISVYRDPMTGDDIEIDYGVDMPDSTLNRKFTVATAQIVDTFTLEGMVAATHPCSK